MKLDIKLSIDKRTDSQHNTLILRWNPAISSYTMKRLDEDMEAWANGAWEEDFGWSRSARRYLDIYESITGLTVSAAEKTAKKKQTKKGPAAAEE